MTSTLDTLKHIATILSFHSIDKDLKKLIINHAIKWDEIVRIGSQHRVLPAIYYRLEQRSLLALVPKDLASYLKELAFINRNRNKEILKQIRWISKLFEDNQIEHAFLKGAALLQYDFYSDLGERMLGDIDILVALDDTEKAANLLVHHGYVSENASLATKYGLKRHLPRLIKKDLLASVELHTRLFDKNHNKLLNPKTVLESKTKRNGISIPNVSDLLKHVILGFQINDKGYYYRYANFSSIYDTLVILNSSSFDMYSILPSKDKYYKSYFLISSYYFDDFKHNKPNFVDRIILKFYTFRLNNKILNKCYYMTLRHMLKCRLFFSRLIYGITNTRYLKDLFKTKLIAE